MRGEGARLWDAEGSEYLDFFAGLSVHNAGHCHPRIVAAIREQAARFAGTSNLFYSEPGDAARASGSPSRASAARSSSATPAPRRTSARSSWSASAPTRAGSTEPEIVILDGAFHGRTLGALAATPKLAREDLFGPLPRGFVAVPRDDPDALRAAVGERTAAVMIEPIQGEAGIFPIADEVLVAAREACDAAGARAGLRRGPVRDGEDRDAVGLRAAAGAPGRDHGGQGARRRPAGRRRASPRPSSADVLARGDHGSTFAGGADRRRARRSRRST